MSVQINKRAGNRTLKQLVGVVIERPKNLGSLPWSSQTKRVKIPA